MKKNLTLKLENIQNNITKEENRYHNLKNEIFNMINKTENYKNFKINELDDEKQLFINIKKHNQHFKIQTTSTFWFNKEVVELFGYEYIATTDKQQQETLEAFYNNDEIKAYKKMLTANPNFEIYYLDIVNYMKKELLYIFTPEFIATKFDENIQKLCLNLIIKKRISIFQLIFFKNPNFKLYVDLSKFYKNEHFFEKNIFNLFVNSSRELQYAIKAFSDCDCFQKLLNILDINKNLSETFYNNIIYGEENSYASKTVQNVIITQLSIEDIIKLYSIENINKNLLKYCAFNDDPENLIDFYKELSEENKDIFIKQDFNDVKNTQKSLKKIIKRGKNRYKPNK